MQTSIAHLTRGMEPTFSILRIGPFAHDCGVVRAIAPFSCRGRRCWTDGVHSPEARPSQRREAEKGTDMAKPAILTVDDDPQVLRAVERDLRKKYAKDYRIVRAESGDVALDALQRLKLQND